MMRQMNYCHKKFFEAILSFFLMMSAFFIAAPHVRAAQVQYAIITTVDSDGLKGSYSWIPEARSGGSRLYEHNMMPTIADIRVASYGRYYYILEGEGLNRITLFDSVSLDEQIRQYSAQGVGETSDPLPWDMVFINEHKAYLLRYGSSAAWIVDPLAENEDNFNTGTLDLSAYDEGDGSPEMCCGVVVGTKAFIVLKRLNASLDPQTAYMAVFDTDTNEQINTQQDPNLSGIPLFIKNPVSINYLSQTGMIYVQGSGTIDPQPDYTGGIEQIDPNTYVTSMVLDDGDLGDPNSHPYGYITAMAIISETDAFFIGAASPTDNSLYHFNPTTGAAEMVAFNASNQYYLQHKEFAGLSGGIGLDQQKRLWIGNITDRRVEIINTTPNQGLYESNETIDIPDDSSGDHVMQPSQIVFCLEPAVTDEDEAQKPSSSGEGGNFCFLGTLRGNW